MTIPEPRSCVALTVDFVRNKYFESFDGRRQADRAAIKCLMMNTAQRQSVRNLIRATRRVPFDVGCLQSEKFIFQAKIKPTNGATALVCA